MDSLYIYMNSVYFIIIIVAWYKKNFLLRGKAYLRDIY